MDRIKVLQSRQVPGFSDKVGGNAVTGAHSLETIVARKVYIGNQHIGELILLFCGVQRRTY